VAQSLSFTEGGNITADDVEEWTEKLSDVMDVSPGWHKIRIYLELMQLKSEQALLDFWEKCSTFLLKTKKQTTDTSMEIKLLISRSMVRKFHFLVFPSMGPKFCMSKILLCFVNILL
jgi:hypothetical protein